MRIAFYVPTWKKHHGGAQWAMLRLAQGLKARGHAIQLCHDSSPRKLPYGKAHTWTVKSKFDVVMCAGGMPDDRFGKQHGAIVRNVHHSTVAHWAPYGKAHGIIWCAETYRRHYYARGVSTDTPNIVSHPIIDPDAMRTESGDRVTLINPMPEKGGDLFWELVDAMPDVQFMAVQGGWHKKTQIQPDPMPTNATWLPFQTDVRQVYRQTRVLLYPLGRTAPPQWIDGAPMAPVEAACSGIPTIATPQPGMVEVMGGHACMVEGHEVKVWAEAIRSVLANLGEWQAKARQRADQLNPAAEIDKVEQFIREFA
jgi:glycosyltransferase involved in cell wall biosynthesis